MALRNAATGQTNLVKMEEITLKITDLRQRVPTEEIAIEEAKALYNLAVVEIDSLKRAKITRDLGHLFQEFPNDEIATAEARAVLLCKGG